tara:strand:+ start:1432 stop:1674 length:243 start_codon:yes stop_codon:yes gene_type:complete
MLSIIRNTTTQEVVFVSLGNVTQTNSGVTCDEISDLTGTDWGTDAGFEKIEVDMELPSDYPLVLNKLVDDGDGYRFEQLD